jgi:hypothetical protein
MIWDQACALTDARRRGNSKTMSRRMAGIWFIWLLWFGLFGLSCSRNKMKLPAAAYSVKVTTSATKAGSDGVFGEGE